MSDRDDARMRLHELRAMLSARHIYSVIRGAGPLEERTPSLDVYGADCGLATTVRVVIGRTDDCYAWDADRHHEVPIRRAARAAMEIATYAETHRSAAPSPNR